MVGLYSGDASRLMALRQGLGKHLDRAPVWTPNGQRLLFSSDRGGASNVFAQLADGSGSIERLTNSRNDQLPTGISPDGKYLLLRESPPLNLGSADVTMLSLETAERGEHHGEPGENSTSDTKPLMRSSVFLANNAAVSPDGRWLAYQTDESGRDEIYVRPFPDVNAGRWQVSMGFGREPVWASKGRELFYLTIGGGALMRVLVENSASWSAGMPSLF